MTDMTDTRHCDGPGCEKTAPLNAEVFIGSFVEPSAEDYLEVRGFNKYHGQRLHFHNDNCMTQWARQVGKEN